MALPDITGAQYDAVVRAFPGWGVDVFYKGDHVELILWPSEEDE